MAQYHFTVTVVISLEDCLKLGLNMEKQSILKQQQEEALKEEDEMEKEIAILGLDKEQESRWRLKQRLDKLATENNGEGSHIMRPCPNPECHMIIRKTGGCPVMTCPACKCEFDWPTGETADKELGYLGLNYHMDTSKFRAYWTKLNMDMDWILTGKVKKTV